jgi:hypothetical protein
MLSLSPNRVVLVRQGRAYGPEYVEALIQQLPGYDVLTLTDQSDTPGETSPLTHGLKGWWAKLELFAPENEKYRPYLYIDLDSFVFGTVDRYMGGDDFVMVKDFNNVVPANSSVMWIPKDVEHIWYKFSQNPEQVMADCGGHGDQKYLGRFADRVWDKEGIVSYKNDGVDAPSGTIMQFHGRPKMKDAKGWARERWEYFVGKS